MAFHFLLTYLIEKGRRHRIAQQPLLSFHPCICWHVDMVIWYEPTENFEEEFGAIKVLQPSHGNILSLPEIADDDLWRPKWSDEELNDGRVELITLSGHPSKDLVSFVDMLNHRGNISKD